MIKIVIVCSSNKTGKPAALIDNQAISLQKEGVGIEYLLIKEKGFKGYFKSIIRLRKKLRQSDYDLIHAHGLASLPASLAFKKPLIVSVMGSELVDHPFLKPVYRFLTSCFWNHVIVKSNSLLKLIGTAKLSKVSILPNGVDLATFRPIDKLSARKKTGLDTDKIFVLFMADPARKSKNYPLAEEAVNILKKEHKNLELLVQYNNPKEKVPDYLNSADVVLLTSRWEGSPNIVKEAMACNRPVVATDVGDVKFLFENTPGCFITSDEAGDVALKIKEAIEYSESGPQGRQRIIQLGLDSESVARKLIEIYSRFVSNS